MSGFQGKSNAKRNAHFRGLDTLDSLMVMTLYSHSVGLNENPGDGCGINAVSIFQGNGCLNGGMSMTAGCI